MFKRIKLDPKDRGNKIKFSLKIDNVWRSATVPYRFADSPSALAAIIVICEKYKFNVAHTVASFLSPSNTIAVEDEYTADIIRALITYIDRGHLMGLMATYHIEAQYSKYHDCVVRYLDYFKLTADS